MGVAMAKVMALVAAVVVGMAHGTWPMRASIFLIRVVADIQCV